MQLQRRKGRFYSTMLGVHRTGMDRRCRISANRTFVIQSEPLINAFSMEAVFAFWYASDCLLAEEFG